MKKLILAAALAICPAIASAQAVDPAGNARVVSGLVTRTLSGWTSATGVNATQEIFNFSGASSALLHLVQTSTITGGAITFEVTYDGSTWVTVPADAVVDPASTSLAAISLPYTLVASTNKPFLIIGKGWQGLRIKLSTAITGTATVTPNYALLDGFPYSPVRAVQPTAADLNATVTGTVTANAGSGTFVVGDGAGSLNTIVDSGTVTANAGTGTFTTDPSDRDARVLGRVKIHDGTDTALVSAGGALLTDASATTQPVSGTVTADQGGAPWSVAGPAADGAAVSGNPVRIGGKDGSGNTQDVATDTSGELQVDVLSVPANQSVNLAQVAGSSTSTGNGTAAGSIRVSVASDSTGTIIATQATASSLNVRDDTSGATGAAPPARAQYIGGLASGATGGFLTGITVCDSWFSVDIVTATTVLAVTGVSGRHVYICSVNLVTAAANNVAIVAGTGATCGTSTAGMNGGTTAAEGWNFAANGGIAQGTGFGAVMRTETTGDSVCIITSAATQLSGAIGYTIY